MSFPRPSLVILPHQLKKMIVGQSHQHVILLVLVIVIATTTARGSAPSYTVTKSTPEGELIQVNLLEKEIDNFFSIINQFPTDAFNTQIDEYFPDMKYITNVTQECHWNQSIE